MAKAPLPLDENTRLQNLLGYDILDTPDEEDFDEIVRLASSICNTPISLVSLVDANRQWFKARVGVDARQTSRDISFCSHAILSDDIFIVPDTTKDERFLNNPFVTGDPDVRFYAGVPLVSPRGGNMGTLCVIDRVPRELPEDKKQALIVLGKQVVKLMELRRMNANLLAVTERQNTIISILAHDIRSPLGSLKNLLSLLPERQDPAALPLLDMADSQLDTTLSLLDNLVDWGSLQVNGNDCGPTDLGLQEIAARVLGQFEVQASLKQLSLVNRVDAGIRLFADENRVCFILRNLLTNAIKFTRSGTITVDASVTATEVRLSVEDTGIGMPPDILEQLFEGGKKISRKGTDNEVGSGLGLSLVKEFVGQMSGSLTVHSEQGKGTTIQVGWPRVQ